MMLAMSVADLLGGFILLCAFLQISRRRLTAMITLSQLSSLALTCVALWQGMIRNEWLLFGVGLLIFGVQVIILPVLMRRLINRFSLPLIVHGTLPVTLAMLIGLVPIGLAITSFLPLSKTLVWPLGGEAVAFSVLLLGVWLVITKTPLLAWVIGFITLANGLVLAFLDVPGLGLVTLIAAVVLNGLAACLLLMLATWYQSLLVADEVEP